jgi:undecaprenyl phosphate-alpha-L-ara4N flippase subunit ArnF
MTPIFWTVQDARWANSFEKSVNDSPRSATESQKPRTGWFFNPYVQLSMSILLSSSAQLFLKKGADNTVPSLLLGVEILRSGWGWLGIAAIVTSLFCWLYSLRFVPLNIAFNLAGLVLVLVPLEAWFFLGERIGLTRWCGIVLVCAGVYVVARPLMRVEEKL